MKYAEIKIGYEKMSEETEKEIRFIINKILSRIPDVKEVSYLNKNNIK
ncbi:hypothetical protein ACFHWD_03755 [Clostridium sp. MT-14]